MVLIKGAVAAELVSPADALRGKNVEWPVYRGDPQGNQYAAGAQIHAANVHQLEVAWEYRTGDDIWDYDNPSAPVLATIRTGNVARDVVVQFTKMGLTCRVERDRQGARQRVIGIRIRGGMRANFPSTLPAKRSRCDQSHLRVGAFVRKAREKSSTRSNSRFK